MVNVYVLSIKSVCADVAVPKPEYAAEELPPPRLPPYPTPQWLYGVPLVILIVLGGLIWSRHRRGNVGNHRP